MRLNATVNLHLDLKLGGLGRAAKPALAGLLALLLLASGMLSVSRALHQSFHSEAAGSHHLCLVCLFANGQISAADVMLVVALLLLCPPSGKVAAKPAPLPAFDYRLSPSRAPPRA